MHIFLVVWEYLIIGENYINLCLMNLSPYIHKITVDSPSLGETIDLQSNNANLASMGDGWYKYKSRVDKNLIYLSAQFWTVQNKEIGQQEVKPLSSL